jgi:hypothetical protein
MPPEQENLNRQLEALQQCVAGLQTQRERGKARQPPPAGQPRRPSWRWLLLTLVLVVAALAGGILIGAAPESNSRTASRGPAGSFAAATTRGAPAASPQCRTAVDRANNSLTHAVKVENALAEHTAIMNDLLNGKIDGGTALKTGTPSLIVGAAESSRFDLALADYKQVVDQCKLLTP